MNISEDAVKLLFIIEDTNLFKRIKDLTINIIYKP